MRSIHLALLLSLCSQSYQQFCQDVCGEYTEEDETMKNIQKECKAYEEDQPCPDSSLESSDYNTQPSEGDMSGNHMKETRIVNGHNPADSLPWMVMMIFDQELCGGTLINSRFVLTAAHCSCTEGGRLCSRMIGKVKDEPITITDDQDIVRDGVKLFIGATSNKVMNISWTVDDLQSGKADKGLEYRSDRMFVHPLLSTSEKLRFTPDILLIRLAKPVNHFSSTVLPVCLHKPGQKDVPVCPDNSVDKISDEEAGSVDGKYLGGCGIIAGWGSRYSERGMAGSSCSTKPLPQFPARAKYCTKNLWLSQGKKIYDCDKKHDPMPEDLHPDCKNFIYEVNFQALVKASQFPWRYGNYDNITFTSPVIILDSAKNRNITCSTTNMYLVKKKYRADNPTKEGQDFPGWCATKVDKKKRVLQHGLCKENCRDERTGLNFANMNVLTAEECKEITKTSNTLYNDGYEMCAGKKNMFPPNKMFFVKLKKNKKDKRIDKKAYKKMSKKQRKENKYAKPRAYKYNYQAVVKDFEGLPDDYKYNWYLGGVDTCQGDSGGPLWRNVKVGKKVRATQLGVVSRGQDCAIFNQAGLYTRVTKIYDWLKETVEKNSGKTNLCPKKKG